MSAEQGHASAQYNLGLKYGNGQGVPQDYKEAVKWTRMSRAGACKGSVQPRVDVRKWRKSTPRLQGGCEVV